MKTVILCCLIPIFSYLLGSINFALLISFAHKNSDIREYGSGNAGMTNMLRVFGKRAAIATLIGDFSKGYIAVFFSRYLVGDTVSIDFGYIAALFVIIGHVFPVFFGFRGGKGVATAFGAMLALNSIVFISLLIGLVPMIFIIRIVSAVSLTGASIYPVLTFLVLILQNKDIITVVIPNTIFSILITVLTFYAHRENIKRFRTGSENFFGEKNEKQNKKI